MAKAPVDGPNPDLRRSAPPTAAELQHFGNPVHCVRAARDDWSTSATGSTTVFRSSARTAVYVKEFMAEPVTAGNGSVWDIVISRDPQQKWLFLADGRNNQVLTLSRDTGAVVSQLGRPGRYAGEFHWVHDLAIDSKGNLYAGEVDTGKRVQRFVRQP